MTTHAWCIETNGDEVSIWADSYSQLLKGMMVVYDHRPLVSFNPKWQRPDGSWAITGNLKGKYNACKAAE